MNVFRVSNFYVVGRNLCPDYAFCTSLYKIDNNLNTSKRQLYYGRPLYASNKSDNNLSSASGDSWKIDNIRKLHFTQQKFTSVEEVATQVLSFFKTIKMEDLKQAPQPIFWYSVAGLIPFLGPPLTFLTFGYSSALVTLQLVYGATISSFIGGMKWGYSVNEPTKHEPSWTNLGWSIIPQMLGWFGLLMPQSLGYLLVISGIAVAGFVDLTATNYPQWFKAVRLAVTVPALFGLILTLIIHIFH